MGQIDKKLRKEFDATRKNPKYLCNAPFCSVYISPGGLISPCWDSCNHTHGFHLENTINEIWKGKIFNEYRKNIKSNILLPACECCENRLKDKEFYRLPIREYDDFEVKRIGKNKIQTAKIYLSNTCNLKCIMCDESLSSQFSRTTTYTKEALNNSNLTDELLKYATDLKVLMCLGGEPFLIEDYYKLWNKLINNNPQCEIYIITNGTILNDRIKDLLRRGNFKIQFSLHSLNKDTYEKIMVNANFETAISNMDYFGSTMQSQGKTFVIHTCALKANRYEIPKIVQYCNDKSYQINIRPVYKIYDVALYDLPSIELKDLQQYYKSIKFKGNGTNSHTNIANYNDFVSSMDFWIDAANRKENFKNIFDLKTDNIEKQKTFLFQNIYNAIKIQTQNNIYEIEKKYEFVCTKFNRIMKSLPDYFNSNHFYNVLIKNSPTMIIEQLTMYNDENTAKIFTEIFFEFKH